MNTQHTFVAERAAAQHCAELLRGAADPAELLPALARPGERFARTLAPALVGLLGGDLPSISVADPATLTASELEHEVGPLAANSLLSSPGAGLSLFASIESAAVLRLVDRAFGGKGEQTSAVPHKFPLSAKMLAQRLNGIVAQCLGEALGLQDLICQSSECRIADLVPFLAGTKLACLRLEVSEAGRASWPLLIALPLVQLSALVGKGDDARPAKRRGGAADPATAPYADLPLPLCATLVDMRVPLSVIAALEPGAVLPVAVARAVPVSSGGALLARGTVGAQDDRIAVKLTQIA